MAFGTWGGLGPEAAKLLARMVGRAAAWQEGPLRAWRQQGLREGVGLALMTHIWALLDAKNQLQIGEYIIVVKDGKFEIVAGPIMAE